MRKLGVSIAFLLAISIAAFASSESLLFSFTCSGGNLNGCDPYTGDGLIVGAGNTVYGELFNGGYYGTGVVFSYGSGGFTVLSSLCGANCVSSPTSSLVQDSEGNLYGGSLDGVNGNVQVSTLYKVSSSGASAVYLWPTQTQPYGQLAGPVGCQDGSTDTCFYGTDLLGGTNKEGEIYRFDITTGVFTSLYSFCSQTNCTDGAYPLGGVSLTTVAPLGSSLIIVGTTQNGGLTPSGQLCHENIGNLPGCGVVWRFSVSGNGGTYTVLHQFTGHGTNGSDASYPASAPTYYSGKLYGTTRAGGTSDGGAIYSVGLDGSNETVLYSSDGKANGNGGQFVTPPVFYDGTMYGTAPSGGTNTCYGEGYESCGIIYSMTQSGSSWTYSMLYNFLGAPNDGAVPQTPMTQVNGSLYILTVVGGDLNCEFGCGALVSYTP